jgi:hypothetical protein
MALTPKGQIHREGTINFGDASLNVWEEGIPQEWKAREAWEQKFKREVFARIVQTLNRLGWKCEIPQEYIKQYNMSFARNRRACQKGDLHGFLDMSGRHIEFKMWQGVNTPTRPDHGGRYESNKEACAPYLLRLEMDRTRQRIRDYLCNVFTRYEFSPPKISSPNPDPLAYFNNSWDGEYEKRNGTHRFKRGADGWPCDDELRSWDRKDKDGTILNHGDVRWMHNRKGQLIRGRVYGGINGMWMFVYGPGQADHLHENAGKFFTYRAGETPRKLADNRLRKNRLQDELAKAIKAMNFERAATLRDIIFPKDEPFFVVWHTEHKLYHRPNFSGYTADIIEAGKFTQAECKGYTSHPNEVRALEAA